MEKVKNWYSTNKYFFLISTICLLLPWDQRIIGAPIILLSLIWILEGDIQEKLRQIIHNKSTLLYVTFFLLFVLGLAYSENTDKGISTLTKELSFLIFPMVISTIPTLRKDEKNKIALYFTLSVLLAFVTCLGKAFYKFYYDIPVSVSVYGGFEATQEFYRTHPEVSKIWAYITYSELAMGIDGHPTYLSIICILAINLLAFYTADQPLSLSKRFFLSLIIIFLIAFIFLLSSRIALIALATLPFIYALKLKIKPVKLVSIFVLVLASLLLALSSSPVLKSRFVSEWENFKIEIPKEKTDILALASSKTKYINWLASFEVIQDNWLFGVGTGDYQDEMNKKYKKYGFEETTLNAHNQYLQIAMMFGIFGLFVFLAMLMLAVFESLKSRDFLYFIFIFSFILFCFTESMLMRQQGIIYFALFNNLFYYHKLGLTRSPDPDENLKSNPNRKVII